jgi:hypothetical protein
MMAVAIMLAPASSQAACNGGACPITGGSLRTVVGGGFVIPQVTPFAGFVGNPTGKQMSFANTAMGFVLPTPSAMVTVAGASAPYTINVPIGQLTYGDASATVLSKVNVFPYGRYATPVLVQVPLFNFAPTFLGVSTNIGQSFPGAVRTTPTTGTPNIQIGGPGNFKKNGRPGAPTLTHCPGAVVPATIPANWQGGCVGFTPTQTTGGGPGVQVAPALVQYVKTANQFGGTASQRQVKRTPIIAPGEATWLGRIRFNRAGAPYTVNDFLVDANPGSPFTPTPGTPVTPKTYPTQPQNLVEPVAWGAGFGVIVQRLGAAPGDIVSGRVTPAGGPLDTATQLVRVTPPGTGQGNQATSTTWGGPMTTGKVVVQALTPGGVNPISTWTNTGNDQRTAGGQGMVNLVSGSLSVRTSSNVSVAGSERTMLTLKLPEPSMALGLIAGVAALVGVSRRRIS